MPTLTPVNYDPFAGQPLQSYDAVNAASPMAADSLFLAPATIQSRDPSWRETLYGKLQSALEGAGASRGYAQNVSDAALGGPTAPFDIATYTPGVGNMLLGNDAVRSANAGNYGSAALEGVGAVMPPMGSGKMFDLLAQYMPGAAERAAVRTGNEIAVEGAARHNARVNSQGPDAFNQYGTLPHGANINAPVALDPADLSLSHTPMWQRLTGAAGEPANANASLPPPLTPEEKFMRNTRGMSTDELLSSDPLWGHAQQLADHSGVPFEQAFAESANRAFAEHGHNAFMTPDIARRFIAAERAKFGQMGGLTLTPVDHDPFTY